MVLPHLLRMSVGNLVSRLGRTLFLILGVAVGTGTLAFLLALSGGIRQQVEGNLQAFQAVMAERQELLAQQDELLASLPVNQLTVRPRSNRKERIGAAEVAELEQLPGVVSVTPVAFLFPVTVGVRGKNLAIMGMQPESFQNEMKIPTTVYGIAPGFMTPAELLPNAVFDPVGEPDRVVPVVLPADWLDYLTTLKTEDMRRRFAEMVVTEITRRMERDADFRRRIEQRAKQFFGLNAVTAPLLKDVIEDAMGELLSALDRERLAESIELTLFPGIDARGQGIRTKIVGYSERIPGTGVSVPLAYIDEWNQAFNDDAGLLTRVLAKDTDLAYSEVHVVTRDLAATLAIYSRLNAMGYKVEAQIEEARRLDRQLAELSAEGARLKGESERASELNTTLEQATLIISLLLFAMAGTVIVYGLSLSVLEQQRRIGILRAVGARRVDILTIFLFEALVVGAFGALLGQAAARAGVLAFGARLLATVEGSAPVAAPAMDWQAQVLIFALGAGFSLLAGLIPALKASWVQPVEVLKH